MNIMYVLVVTPVRRMQAPYFVVQAVDPFVMSERINQTKSKEENHTFGLGEIFSKDELNNTLFYLQLFQKCMFMFIR